MAKRGYPTSEDGAAAASARLRQCRSSQEELPAAQGQEWKQCKTLFYEAPKSLQMMIAAIKLKILTPWKENYDQPR